MAAIPIASFDLGTCTFSSVVFGAAAIRGVVIKDVADGSRWKNGIANSTDVLAGKDGLGILIHPVSAADRQGIIITDGTIYIEDVTGATEGVVLVMGNAVAGQMVPDADVATSTNFKTILGTVGDSTVTTNVEFVLNLQYTGQQIP